MLLKLCAFMAMSSLSLLHGMDVSMQNYNRNNVPTLRVVENKETSASWCGLWQLCCFKDIVIVILGTRQENDISQPAIVNKPEQVKQQPVLLPKNIAALACFQLNAESKLQQSAHIIQSE